MRLLILAIVGLATAFAGEPMPVAQQNALVGKYCAVCHTDVTRNGGLSLEHFDAARVAPSLAAMMISKMTHGAMGAAGIPRPDQATIDQLISALAAKASGAREWSIERGPGVTASILRELPGATFRLVVTCNPATREGDVQLAWAPLPKTGSLTATIDGKTTLAYGVEGSFYGLGKMTLPVRTLAIHSDFQTGALEFPFSELPGEARQALGVCFQ